MLRTLACLVAAGTALTASGPLRILKSNPRYFTDNSGRAIYLAGSHNWHSLQDNGHRLPPSVDAPPVFNYEAYLDNLHAWHHNFFRLWRWEVTQFTDEKPPGLKYCQPHPWPRTGPGMARDGKPKFDLRRLDPAYFDRLRARVKAARDRGIYVSVMLFEGWAVQFLKDAWTYHPFNPENNINGADGAGKEFYALKNPQVTALQEAYVRKVVDTVNDLDNVLYEICNESGDYSTEWQYAMVRFVKTYESGKPQQHPVGMTVQYRGGTNQVLYDSPADWISPNTGQNGEHYVENPPATHPGKVIVNDTDHLWGHTGGDATWVWKSFCRGLNVLFMEELTPSPTWQDSAREGMGQTRRYAERINLAAMLPAPELASTRYCLADRGREYLVFQSGANGEFSVNLSGAPGTFSVEWLSINTGKTIAGKPVEGGEVQRFPTPFGGPAVLYLKRI